MPRKAEAESEATSAGFQKQSLGPLSHLGGGEPETYYSGTITRDLSWPAGSGATAPISSLTAEVLLLGHTEVSTSPQTHPVLLHFPGLIPTVPSARNVFLSAPEQLKFYLSF